jgi:carbon monoxide dehydrogenase subunit G
MHVHWHHRTDGAKALARFHAASALPAAGVEASSPQSASKPITLFTSAYEINMELTSTQFIPAPQQVVWEALNDPELLKSCIKGCESIEASSDAEYVVVLAARIGPVTARFKGKLMIKDRNPPESYSLEFEGQGGAAGHAKGGAQVSLAPEGAGTNLTYTAKAQVGGKLAQIGSRLIDSVAKKMADDFFTAFVAKVGTGAAEAAAANDVLMADEAGVPAETGTGKKSWSSLFK